MSSDMILSLGSLSSPSATMQGFARRVTKKSPL